MSGPAPSVLLGLTGLEIDGGIAAVARCVTRAVDELAVSGVLARADRILLQDDVAAPPAPPPRGSQVLSGDHQLRFVWQLWRRYRRTRHDQVFFDQLGLARSVGVPLPGFPPARYSIFCHGIELDRVEGGPRLAALRGAWRLLANSERTGNTLRERFPDLAERVRVVPLCIDPARTADWESGTPAVATDRRERAALLIGRMWSEERGKGHDALLEGWSKVRARVPGAQLWIVGDGDDRPRLEAKARELAPDGDVRFFGRVSDEELGRLYRSAALFAMPSRQEGFGLVYAEAMWHGLACIGSTADAARHVIDSDQTGLLVPYGDVDAIADAVARLLEEPETCARMGAEGMRQARERFAYPRFARDLRSALDLPEPEGP